MKAHLRAGIFPPAGLAAPAAGRPGNDNVLHYGARDDGPNNNPAAVPSAMDICAANGGGQVIFPGGKTFLTGAITRHRGVDFHLARGAVLKGFPRGQDHGGRDGNDHVVWQKITDEPAGVPPSIHRPVASHKCAGVKLSSRPN
jgi:hypothetical protein